MSENFEPGDVAMITTRDGVRELGFCFQGGPVLGDYGQRARWRVADNEVWSSVTDVRPVAVIDPEDREQVERLAKVYLRVMIHAADVQTNLSNALREFANPTPPRPDEPQGLGAVVEDADGHRFVRSDVETCNPWRRGGGIPFEWIDITAVRVLSEGVS